MIRATDPLSYVKRVVIGPFLSICLKSVESEQTSRQREDLLGRIYTTHDMVTK